MTTATVNRCFPQVDTPWPRLCDAALLDRAVQTAHELRTVARGEAIDQAAEDYEAAGILAAIRGAPERTEHWKEQLAIRRQRLERLLGGQICAGK